MRDWERERRERVRRSPEERAAEWLRLAEVELRATQASIGGDAASRARYALAREQAELAARWAKRLTRREVRL